MAFSFGTPSTSTAGQSAGGSAPAPFSFGQPAQQQQQQSEQNKPGALTFGAPSAQTGQNNASATGPSGGLFGGFGSSQQPQQQQQAPASGGLFSFGAKPAASTAPGQPQGATSTGFGGGSTLFGSSSNTQNAGTGGFSFGAPQQQQQQQPQQQQQQQQPSSLFGAPTSSFTTGVNGTQGFGQQNVTQSQPQLQPQASSSMTDKKLGASLAQKLEQIRAAWDTNNAAGCRFAYYFYNNAGNAQNLKLIQGRRGDAVGPMHDQLWAASIRENPDPNRLYPVLALGFDDLKKRVESQHREAQRQRALLASLAQRLSSLEQKHSLGNSVRAEAAVSRQSLLHHKLVGLVAKSQLLIPALRGKSIGPEEERLISILEACEAEVTGIASTSTLNTTAPRLASGNNSGMGAQGAGGSASQARLRSKINELWAQLGVVRAKRELVARSGAGGRAGSVGPGDGRSNAAMEWAVVDAAGLENVARILGQQQQGLNHLSTTLENDTKTMDTIASGLSGVKLVGVSR